jgi:hypothetical protein
LLASHARILEDFLMRLLRSARWLLLALVITLIPVSSQAGVFISVGFAPPVLPVYEQPPCPEPGLMWTPGYWAYGPDGYYWVPGAWVPAPYEGALWTPPYWGWSGGLYVLHEGYWGRHIGYYGGVNYGFGYGGIGFAGGEWHGHDFRYNTAVVHVDGRFVHNTFMDRGRVDRGFVARDSHVAFSGGPGGIRHDPRPEERFAEHDQHQARTSFQTQHESSARGDRNSYVHNNGGHPQNLVAARPLGAEQHAQPGNNAVRGGGQNAPGARPNAQPGNNSGWGGGQNNANPRSNAQPGNNAVRGGGQFNAGPQANTPRSGPVQQQRPAAQPQQFQQQRPAAQPQQRNAPAQQQQFQQQRPTAQPQQRNAPAQQQQFQQQRPAAQPQQRNAPAQQQQFQQQRPAAQPRPSQAPAAHSAPEPRSAPRDDHKR